MSSSKQGRQKESVNDIQKGQKSLKECQESILMEIEKQNIGQNVKELLKKFSPPPCKNCPKRLADRVCTNKECGPEKYLSVICGKCHSDVHAKSTMKPEIEIEEYLAKLAFFLHEHKFEKDSMKSSRIDTENLKQVFNNIDSFRDHLNLLKSKIKKEIEVYSSPQQMHSILSGSVTKALSLCEYVNIQEQLRLIKANVLFENNKFMWNDIGQKYKQFPKIFYAQESLITDTNKIITNSFIDGGYTINLDSIQFRLAPKLSIGHSIMSLQGKDGVLRVGGNGNHPCSYFMDYKLNWGKKYKLRVKFEQNPRNFIIMGIMPFSMVNTLFVQHVHNEYFCKRFFNNSPSQECARILKGTDLSYFPKEGTQIEMRVDLNESYMDFADYPEYKNINANHLHFKLNSKEQYVIAFSIFERQSILIESFEEISEIN